MSQQDRYEAVMGAAQDAIVETRFELVKLLEGDPDFAGCRTDLDVNARMLELAGEPGLRMFWADRIRTTYPKFSALDVWFAKLLDCVRARDERRFGRHQQVQVSIRESPHIAVQLGIGG
jgi:hypothetical protein